MMLTSKALTALTSNHLAWLLFPEFYRNANAKRSHLKSKAKALIRHDHILRGEP